MSRLSPPDATSKIVLNVNGETRTLRVRNDEPLVRTLRREFELTSVRGTCGIGICGTCTVLLDGRVASSCILLTVQAADRTITTSEGLLAADGGLSEVQEAFVRNGAYQCSFCIPAMALTVHAALTEGPDRDVEEVREYLGGNLCRCGTYPQILEAVRDVLGAGRAAAQEPR